MQGLNHFIVFEGLDASGKTTLSQLLAKGAKNSRLHTAIVPQGNDIRRMLETIESPDIALHFFLLNNHLKSQEINNELKGANIILDRYVFSTLAYQTLLQGVEKVRKIFEILELKKSLIMPDAIVFVKADRETVSNRISGRTEKLQWYGDALTQKMSVEDAYHTVFSWFTIPIIEIDTSEKWQRSIDENYKRMVRKLNDRLNLHEY